MSCPQPSSLHPQDTLPGEWSELCPCFCSVVNTSVPPTGSPPRGDPWPKCSGWARRLRRPHTLPIQCPDRTWWSPQRCPHPNPQNLRMNPTWWVPGDPSFYKNESEIQKASDLPEVMQPETSSCAESQPWKWPILISRRRQRRQGLKRGGGREGNDKRYSNLRGKKHSHQGYCNSGCYPAVSDVCPWVMGFPF